MSEEIVLRELSAPPVDEGEILRYARAGGDREANEPHLRACLAEALPLMSYRAVYRVYPIRRDADGLDLGFARTNASSLIRHLADCDRVILLAVTVGIGIDRLLLRYKRISPAKAWMLDAIGNERVESLADALTEELKEKYGALTSRFSPGYGDLPLSLQKDIFAALPLGKHLGLCLSEGLLITPEKSVTALIGIKRVE